MIPPSTKAFVKRVPIRLDDVDYAQVLYYPRVAHLCCIALEDFFAEGLGLPWPQMFVGHKIAMPTVHLDLTYRRPLRFGDQADIAVTVKELGHRKAVYGFRISNAATGEVTAEAKQVVVFVNSETWQAIPVPEPYRFALKALVA